MSPTIGVLNLVLGAVYTSYGIMTIIDMKRGWRTRGFSHFGAAWMLVVLYGAIGEVLLHTQLANRAATGGWSLSRGQLHDWNTAVGETEWRPEAGGEAPVTLRAA